MSSWTQKSSTAVNSNPHPPVPIPDHPRRIQLQQCLEISKITVYLRKNNQGLSAAHLWQESRPVMKSLISPPLRYLLTYISYSYLAFLFFCLFYPSWYIYFLIFFLKNHPSVLHFLHPASRACVIPPQACGWRTCAESGCGFFFGSALKKQRRDPVGAGDLCRKLHFRLTCSLFL